MDPRAEQLREMNQVLVDNEQRLRLAIETGKIGLWIWNSTDQSNAGDWSQRMKEIFGLPYDAEVTHDMFLKTVHPEDRQRIDQCVQDALAGNDGGNYSAVYRVVSPVDGALRWVTARGRAFLNSQGQAIRFIGAVMDITESKRTEAELNALNAELEMRVAERTAELVRSTLSRQMAVTEERNRMARDIHDTLAQGFTGVIMQLEAAQAAMARGDHAAAVERMTSASDLARTGLGEARRSVQALRPSSLDNGTLCAALEELLRRMTAGLGLQADFILDGPPRPIPATWEEGLLRIAQESLTNTIKHAQAQTFRATMQFGRTEVKLQLVDDGRGFDLSVENDGFGLIGMRERANQMLAVFIQRSEPGKGTEIVVTLPCPNGVKP